MIKISELTKYYKKNARGVIDLNFDIKEGEVFGFIGPNGAGKSTTVRSILNLIFPTSGEIKVMDLDSVKDTVEIRRNIGYLASEVHYYNDMKVLDFLRYSASFFKDNVDERLFYLAKKLDLDLTRKIGDLSFGNKKKVGIVQALVHEPKIYILDEPTTGLDPLMQNIFFDLLDEERKKGATIFFSSHILSEVQRICDRVGVIKDGELIKIEKIDDILKTSAKSVRIKTKDKIEINENFKDYRLINDEHHFTFTGEVKKLLEIISKLNIIDINITEPSLEEIFMHYYESEEE
ncbi:ABC transporter [Candidatus Izimaplasma bacterium ZiA1]|uniref:ABC transporter ATP-binding protein n=1 Tax=Candidatus Izimoplasma sp. ZiA1 TaxID=2024899 RepID=UPI000BAA9556|nr:ABC transporter [Candidatus Izimaplasma bacterium ZiA1]